MAEKIKKGFFKVLPWSVVILMVMTLTLGIWQATEQPAHAAAPTMASAVTADTDHNGTVDQVTITFSATVDINDTFAAADGLNSVTLNDGCTIVNFDYSAVNAPNLTLHLTGCTAGDTSITPTITYHTQGGAGNNFAISEHALPNAEMADATFVVAADGAPPVVTKRETADASPLGGNGKIDQINFTTTENLDDDFSGLTVAVTGYTVSSIDTGDTAHDNLFRVYLTENASSCAGIDQSGCDTDATPLTQITANTTLSDWNGADVGNNIALDVGTVAATDKALPFFMLGAYINGDTAPNNPGQGNVGPGDIDLGDSIQSLTHCAVTIGTANHQYDNNEDVYIDNDLSGDVSVGDTRVTAWHSGTYNNGSTVAGGDGDVGSALETLTECKVTGSDHLWQPGAESVYDDLDTDGFVSIGDSRIYYPSTPGNKVNAVLLLFSEPVTYAALGTLYDDSEWTATPNGLTGFDVSSCLYGGWGCAGLSGSGFNGLAFDVTGTSANQTGVSGGTEPGLAYTYATEHIQDMATVPNNAANFSDPALYDAAQPVMVSAEYLDINPTDGTVDTIETTWSENVIMSGSTAADWTIIPGSINAAFSSAPADATPGTVLDISVTADAGKTGGAVAPTISYNNGDNNNSVTDTVAFVNPAGTTPPGGPATVTDGAGPVILSQSYSKSSNTSGSANRMTLNYSENVVWAGAEIVQFAIANNNLTGYSGGTPSGYVSGSGTSSLLLSTSGTTNRTGVSGATEPTVTYTQGLVANRVKDSTGNDAVNQGPLSLTDLATPIIYQTYYTDLSGDGQVDIVGLLLSENGTYTYQDSDWTITANNLTGLDVTACTACTNTANMQLTATANANLTGVGAGIEPTLQYAAGHNIADAAANNAPNYGPTAITDMAAPTPISVNPATFKDTDNNGTVDRVDITMTEPIVVTYNAGDWSFPTPGEITLNDTGASASGNDIRVTVSADANETGCATTPKVSYANIGNRVNDGKGANTTSFANLNIADGASPRVLSARYLDNNPANGRVDRVEFTTTADRGITCTAFTGNTDFTVGTAGQVGLASAGGDTCASNGTSTVTISLATQGTLNTTGGATAPVVTYTQPGNGVEDGAGNDMPTAAGVSVTDGASPRVLSARYLDNNPTNGRVDRVEFTTTADTGIVCTAFTGNTDFTVGTAGQVGLASAGGDTCASNGTSTVTISLATQGTLNTTGGATAPVVTYTQPGNGVEDGAGNDMPTAAGVSVTDGASPRVLSARYLDNNPTNGRVDRVEFTTTADTGIVCTAFTGNTDFTVGTAGQVGLASAGGDTCASNGTSTVTISLATQGTLNTTGGATAPVVTYTQPGNGVEDGAGNDMPTAAGVSVSDGAAPVRVSAVYKDINNDGTVERIDITMSADTGLACTWNTADWSFPAPGTVNVTGSSACSISGNDIRLTVTGTAALTTGGAVNPTIIYTNNANRITDGATNNTATWAAVTATDAAAPYPVSAAYKDANGDGTVDRVDITMSADTGLACTWNTADWSFPAAGTVHVTGSSACSISGNDIRLTVTGTLANTTGGVTNPTVVYTNNANRITDGAANNTLTFGPATATDAAAPVIVARTYSKSVATSGTVDRMNLTWSENVTHNGLDLTQFAIVNNNLTSFDSDGTPNALSSGSGTTTLVYSTSGTTNLTGVSGLTEPTVAYTQSGTAGNRVKDTIGNDAVSPEAAATVADAAAPILRTDGANVPTYQDNNADGQIDRVRLVFTENTVMTYADANWTAVPNTLAGFDITGPIISGNGSGVITITATASAGLTGVGAGTKPTLAYAHATNLGDAASNYLTSIAATNIDDAAAPVIMTTSPANGATGVDMDANVVITFSEPMTTGSVTYTLGPDPGGEAVGWSGGNTIATYTHTAFNTLTLYTFQITAGNASAGAPAALVAGPVPNPFTFTTLGGGGGGGGGGGYVAGTVVVNGNAATTSNPQVALTLTGTYAAQMIIGNDPNFIGSSWETFATSKIWTLPSGDGLKTVYAKFKDSGNNLSQTASDTITLNVTTGVSASKSTIFASPATVVADGTAYSTITVTLKNEADGLLSGKTVTVSSSRGASDTLTTVSGTTGTDGKATFSVLSSTAGTSTYVATSDGVAITSTATVVFTAPQAPPPTQEQLPVGLNVGDLIKSNLSTSVYYFGSDNKRHLFPNEKTYKSWYPRLVWHQGSPIFTAPGYFFGPQCHDPPGHRPSEDRDRPQGLRR